MIQSLESYQLDDLPTEGKLLEVAVQGKDSQPHFNLSRVNGTASCVNPGKIRNSRPLSKIAPVKSWN